MSKIYVDEIAGIASADTVAIPGHVIQVVSATSSTTVDFTSSSYTDSGISISITPSSTSSKVLLNGMIPTQLWNSAGNAARGKFAIYYGGSPLMEQSLRLYDYGGSGILSACVNSLNFLHAPASTSEQTYTIYVKMDSGTKIQVNSDGGVSPTSTTSLTAMEIAG